MLDSAQILRELKMVSCSSEFLSDFVEKFPASCHVRDVQTKEYLTANHHMVSFCGLQSIYEAHNVLSSTATGGLDLKTSSRLEYRIKNIKSLLSCLFFLISRAKSLYPD